MLASQSSPKDQIRKTTLYQVLHKKQYIQGVPQYGLWENH